MRQCNREVKPAVGLNGALDEGLDRGCVSHIHHDRHRLTSVGLDPFHEACQFLCTARGNHYRCPLLGKEPRLFLYWCP